MAVTIDEVNVDVSPEPTDHAPSHQEPGRTPPDMDRIRVELRRDAERLTRMWTD